jgi:hypothetical protein
MAYTNNEMKWANPEDNIEIHIGLEESFKLTWIGKCCFIVEKREFGILIWEYKDIFVRTYDDLKAYKWDIIQHTIPLKERMKPFRKK